MSSGAAPALNTNTLVEVVEESRPLCKDIDEDVKFFLQFRGLKQGVERLANAPPIPVSGIEQFPINVCVSEVRRVLGECRFFECYLMGKRFEWLSIENGHNEMLVVKASPLG